ncbi:hypothetical protein ACIQU4_14570 [Streptomyces sp. NPDC090741]|uniref:hypothetical protein n=1 Tax=Streptomyces sp. NPDC090741 TaxID=3365967 RepID=UPI003815F929
MSTPEEQQQQGRQEDPYGTQTWQSDTWETGYQPVQPPLGALPGQPVAPEGWFRDEAPQAAGSWPEASGAAAGQPAYQPPAPQPVAPEGWFPHEAPATDWQPGGGSWTEGSAAEQTAYLPPQSAAPAAGAADQTAFLPPYPGPAAPQPAAGTPYEGFVADDRHPAGTPYPASAAGERPASAAAETAYLPPYPGPGGAEPQAAGAPAYPGYGVGERQGAAAAAETAYLPPYPGPAPAEAQVQAQAQPVAPEGWFRDEAPVAQAPAPAAAPAPAGDWAQSGPGAAWAEGAAAEQTAYLPPQAAAPAAGAAEQTAFLPPYPGPGTADPQRAADAAETAFLPPYPGPGSEVPAVAPAAPAEGEGEDPSYSPPTVGGNTLRAVDPAQARAEGRSPIIDPGPQPAILTAALGLLLAGAAAVGDLGLLAPLIVLQGLTAAGWFRLNGMWPARQGIALAFLGALVADAAVLAVDDTYGPGAIIGTLGAWVLLTLVLQLRSHADPDERMYGLMASVASAALAIVCAGYLAADSAAVSVGAASVAVAVFTRALPLPTPVSVGVSLAAATGAGIAVGGLTSVGVGGALLGLAAGVCALIGLRVAAYDYPSKFVHMTAGVALPLAAAAPAVYLIGRVVG